jgi:hypothetical protein
MQKYRLTKINKVDNPLAETAETVEEYRESLSFWTGYGFSPSIDYYVEGYLLTEPKVGEALEFDRTNRNGKEVRGIMFTTEIQSVNDLGTHIEFTTRNSVYKLEKIEL